MKQVKSKNGKKVVLLTPSERKAKFKYELKSGVKKTNAGSFKLTSDKKAIRLSKEERIWRSGFNSGVTSCQKAYFGSKKRKNKR